MHHFTFIELKCVILSKSMNHEILIEIDIANVDLELFLIAIYSNRQRRFRSHSA